MDKLVCWHQAREFIKSLKAKGKIIEKEKEDIITAGTQLMYLSWGDLYYILDDSTTAISACRRATTKRRQSV